MVSVPTSRVGASVGIIIDVGMSAHKGGGGLGLVTPGAMRYRRAHGGFRRGYRNRPDAGRGRLRRDIQAETPL